MSENVYIRARRVVQELAPLLRVVRGRDRALADQLKRAAQSVVLNIAEARGSDAGNARSRFATACGSAKEVRAALHIASDWGTSGRTRRHTSTRDSMRCAPSHGAWRKGASAPKACTTSRRLHRARCRALPTTRTKDSDYEDTVTGTDTVGGAET